MIARAAAGFAIAVAIAIAARRADSLSASGAATAVIVGTVAIAAGWSWGILLLAFFLTGSALSSHRAAQKARATGSVVAKGGARDAVQVLANGALFVVGALGFLTTPRVEWLAIGAGSLAAVSADTWGTEIGTLSSRPPRLITTGRVVPPGTSGGVTWIGMMGTAAGAVVIALVAWLVHWPPRIAAAAAIAGVAGALADSVVGAIWQERRWCPQCEAPTERGVHSCGAPTERTGGAAWITNDAVNVFGGAVGALVALVLAR